MDWVVRLCCAFPVGNANLSYRCILAGVDSHCLLSAFRQHHQCSTRSPPPALPLAKRTCHNFLNAFSLTSWREKFAVKYFAQILFSHAFVALSANDPSLPFPPAFPNCINARRSFQEFRCLLYFFLTFLLAVVCLLLSFFCFRLAFRHVLAFSALICIVFAHFVVACSVFVVASVLRATCNAAASFLCIRFYFITLFFFLLGNFLKTQT